MSNFVGKGYLTKTVFNNLVTQKNPRASGGSHVARGFYYLFFMLQIVHRFYRLRKWLCKGGLDR